MSANFFVILHPNFFLQMKILHTSDWHIGQIFHNYSREEEHKYFFEQLKSIIIKDKPDVLVVSGDIFHTATPTIISQRLYYNFIVDLSRLDSDLQIVIISGNHDSPSRLEAPRPLWEAFNVSVVGMLDYHMVDDDSELNFDASKIEIPITKEGKIIGWVLAVPYLNGNQNVYDKLLKHLKKRPEFNDNHGIVATGHLAVRSADISGHSADIIGKIETLDVQDFAGVRGIDYWAFGHIHFPQAIKGMSNMRYAGSPFPISFNENYQHSVVSVNIEDGKTESTVIPLKTLIPIVDFPSKPQNHDDALPFETVLGQLVEILDDKAYVRVHVQTDKPLTQAESVAIVQAFEEHQAMFCGIQSYFPEKMENTDYQKVKTLKELKAKSPFELGCAVYQKKNGSEMPEELKELFKKACEEAEKVS